MTRGWRRGLVAWVAWVGVSAVAAAEVRVAVASNFAAPMQRLAAAFEQDSGHRVRVSVGSTGALYAQIRNGAPFDVLLAADDETPQNIEREGLGVAGSRITYAIGRLVLWSRQAERVDANGEVLRRGDVERLALANPKLAPYGRAAVETLTRMGVWPAWQSRVVMGENIAQAYQFVSTGNAPMGFVALSQVWAQGQIREGSAWIVPADWHHPIRQDAIVLRSGSGNPAAQALMRYLRSEPARALIRAHGYEN